MKKIFLFAVLFFFLLCNFVSAQDAVKITEQEEPEEELNAFGYPDKSLVKIIENKNIEDTRGPSQPLPECDDKALLEQARKVVSEYIDFNGSTILRQRKALLILKNVDNFVTLPQEEVNAMHHSVVAGRLIELKINKHISKTDIEVCQSDNPYLKSKLYLIMYPIAEGKIQVEIINFARDIAPTFVFEQQ